MDGNHPQPTMSNLQDNWWSACGSVARGRIRGGELGLWPQASLSPAPSDRGKETGRQWTKAENKTAEGLGLGANARGQKTEEGGRALRPILARACIIASFLPGRFPIPRSAGSPRCEQSNAGRDDHSLRGCGDAVGQASIPSSLALVHTQKDARGTGRMIGRDVEQQKIWPQLRDRDRVPAEHETDPDISGMTAVTGEHGTHG